MSALGHFLEREGIPTVSISLIREHTEAVRPPRALWVTFDLGRPLGIPDDAPFQRRVALAALKLLEHSGEPIIADYPEDAGPAGDMNGMSCPVNLGAKETPSLVAEVNQLMPWYDRAVESHGRTTVGLLDTGLAETAELIASALEGELPPADVLKNAADDLVAFYLEASSAFPNPGSDSERKEWLWGETRLARALLDLHPKLAASADQGHNMLARFMLVPAAQSHRLT